MWLNSMMTSMIDCFNGMLPGFHDYQRSQIEIEAQVGSEETTVLHGKLDQVHSVTKEMDVSYFRNVVAYQ